MPPAGAIGKRIVKASRFAAEFFIDVLGEEWTDQQVGENYLGPTREDIQACLFHGDYQPRLR